VKVDIVSDNICPWCFVGKRRFEKVLKQLDPQKVKVEVNWRPFFLDRTLPAPGKNKLEHYAKKFGKARTDQMLPHMKNVGKEEGINFSYGGKIGNTMNSHRLVEFAKKQGKQDAMIEVLFAFYFEQEKDISDDAVLIEAGTKVGLDKDEVAKFLKGNEFKDEIEKQTEDSGVSGVPHFIFDNKYEFSGAQDPEFLLSVFKKLGAC
jgi:predicted DsbA family dithiol-disulfide isomerase